MQPPVDYSDARQYKSILERVYAKIWHFSINIKKYDTPTKALYRWLYIKAFSLFMSIQALVLGKNAVQQYCDEFAAFEPIEDKESDIIKKPYIRKRDEAQLVHQSATLFRLEVSLICLPKCRTIAYALIANDEARIETLSRQLYYRMYYRAAKSHGQVQLDLLEQCVTIIHRTHLSTRTILRRCRTEVSWDEHIHDLNDLARAINFAMPTMNEKVLKGKHWELVGFQGEDPSTDFRGVGELGLHFLRYFCVHHPLYANRIIEESRTQGDCDQAWYPFALGSIHVTQLVCQLLELGLLQRHLLQAEISGPRGVQEFADSFFSFLFVRCHLDWAEGVDKGEISSVFQFEQFFSEFTTYIKHELTQRVFRNSDFQPHRKWW